MESANKSKGKEAFRQLLKILGSLAITFYINVRYRRRFKIALRDEKFNEIEAGKQLFIAKEKYE